MTARGLPPELREAIAQATRDIKPAELGQHAARMSENYRMRGGSDSIRSREEVAAYLTARLPATYAAMSAGLDWTKERLVDFAPQSVLDIGAGPGTASWAAASVFPTLKSFTLLDRNSHLLEAARTLGANTRLRRMSVVETGIGQLKDDLRADLVLAGYALGELTATELARAVPRLWSAAKGVLVIVEPGTPDGYARILQVRESLLNLGARIVAPCPGAYPCPIMAPDWCHFAVRLPRLAAHMRAKSASVPFEDEKFSYLAVAREQVTIKAAGARILARPHVLKHGMRLRLCADSRIAEREVGKRDKPAYRIFARKDWGDAV